MHNNTIILFQASSLHSFVMNLASSTFKQQAKVLKELLNIT